MVFLMISSPIISLLSYITTPPSPPPLHHLPYPLLPLTCPLSVRLALITLPEDPDGVLDDFIQYRFGLFYSHQESFTQMLVIL